MRTLWVAALLAGAVPAAAAGAEREWSLRTKSADIGAALEREGNRESLVLSVHPLDGVRIEPPMVRVDAPALVRPHIAVKFPTTVRAEGKGRAGTVRAALPLDGPGKVRFGDADSNDGALRIEYRYCTAKADCAVETVDIALKAVP
ncbi:hypothetical protein [Azospirillum sp. TSO22-1]|uniref:hypothetical protein n=1 Tax=Azospirillum sp. TSO22-1 TaxID=716789 RepID=UPI000D6170E7|nr:hypothetical protein [Azospirillum sp. TSO22-1]PWC55109.1 hypothetical protein TSO221_05680 [Azospirillum sp. TSO22-1]